MCMCSLYFNWFSSLILFCVLICFHSYCSCALFLSIVHSSWTCFLLSTLFFILALCSLWVSCLLFFGFVSWTCFSLFFILLFVLVVVLCSCSLCLWLFCSLFFVRDLDHPLILLFIVFFIVLERVLCVCCCSLFLFLFLSSVFCFVSWSCVFFFERDLVLCSCGGYSVLHSCCLFLS